MPRNIFKKLKTCLVQFWYQHIDRWLEWQDAKCWARAYHPGWLHCVRKCKHKETRERYKEKILAGYRGEEEC